jgi:hypothetical protein
LTQRWKIGFVSNSERPGYRPVHFVISAVRFTITVIETEPDSTSVGIKNRPSLLTSYRPLVGSRVSNTVWAYRE